MPQAVDDTVIEKHNRESDSFTEFLERIGSEARPHVTTVSRSMSTDESENPLTVIGVVHGGEKSRRAVQDHIRTATPDYVAIELGKGEQFCLSHVNPDNDTLELATAMREAKDAGADVVPIDKNILSRRIGEVRHGRLEQQVAAITSLGRLTIPVWFSFVGVFALLNGITSVAVLLFGAVIASVILIMRGFYEVETYSNDYGVISLLQYTQANSEEGTAHSSFEAMRESHMATEIDRLRQKGSVVAVVGHNHLNSVKKQSEVNKWNDSNFESVENPTELTD